MNPNDLSQGPRGLSGAMSNGSHARPAQESRNGRPNTIPSSTRAEKFEDEKRRIIESCFGKRETDGSISESYITHVRIIEDAAHPSTPPPTQSPPENKKPRVIIVAVKKTGRVRMHKARENANGSFSIGKTWVLDDLSIIHSFTHLIPSNAEEREYKERAGSVGFIITIQKPYYWQASTPKEKDFFIYSLIKIYKKYTGGKLPQLYGFEPQEIEQLVGGAVQSSSTQNRAPQTPSQSGEDGSTLQGLPVSQGSQSDRGRQNGRDLHPRQAQEPSSQERLAQARPPIDRPRQERPRHERPSQERSVQEYSRVERPQERSLQGRPPQDRLPQETPLQERLHPDPLARQNLPQDSLRQDRLIRERPLQSTDSSDSIPRIPGSFPSSDFVRALRPQNSQSQVRSQGPSPADSLASLNSTSTPPLANSESSLRRFAANQTTEPYRNRSNHEASRTSSNERPAPERSQHNESHVNGDSKTSQRAGQIPPILRSGTPNNWQDSQPHKSERSPSNSHPKLDTNPKASDANVSPVKVAEEAVSISQPNHTTEGDTTNERSNNPQNESKSSKSTGYPDPITLAPKPSPFEGGLVLENPTLNGTSSNSANLEDQISKPEELLPPVSSPLPPNPAPDLSPEVETHRPGLGPMIKKRSNKDLANTLRKAATAYNTFKPRAGGAAEKIRDENQKSTDQYDGISGVFPAPSTTIEKLKDAEKSVLFDLPLNDQAGMDGVKGATQVAQPAIPALEPAEQAAAVVVLVQDDSLPEKSFEAHTALKDEPRRKRKSDHSNKYAKILGINPSLLEDRTSEIETILDEFGENGKVGKKTVFENIQSGLRREVAKSETGSWIGTLEDGDERVSAVGEMIDKVIAECEELDCLLTLYNVELGTLSEDVAYIEAQSQGLQVQTANQKLLHTELTNLLNTISISSSDLQLLRDTSLTNLQGLQLVEKTLSRLYTAMLTIDPRLRSTNIQSSTTNKAGVDRSSATGFSGSELSSMRAVQDKKDGYRRECGRFVQRFKQFILIKFREAEARTTHTLEQRKNVNQFKELRRLDFQLREQPKADLWLYSPLLHFTREVDLPEWESILHMYENTAKGPYRGEFSDSVSAWKSITRKPLDTEDVLFTSQEKEGESIVGRKLTVKRAKAVRSDGTSRISTGEKPQDGKVNAYEGFAGALSEMTRMILVEQNFIVDLFHVTSLENCDFVDAIATAPELRRGRNPTEKKTFDPDRMMAKKLLSAVEEIYSFWPTELQNLVDWVVQQETLQGVGLLLSLELQLFELEETNQDFLVQTITKVHDRLAAQFVRFVDEQIKGIEDTKVKIKKRKGVIAFVKTFPNFTIAIENMLPVLRNFPPPPIRAMVDTAYSKIHKAMFESLKFIAKESPVQASTAAAAGDPEDKEALNHHILLIENMNHYLEEVPARGNPVLEEWMARAERDMSEHMELYLSAAIRRPLGKLLDFLESTESLLSNPATDPSSVALRASHSRPTFKKLLATYDVKEIRRGVETLRKRVEKHFGDADEPEISRALVGKVWKECEAFYIRVGERIGRVVREVYSGSMEGEWRQEDLVAAFRR